MFVYFVCDDGGLLGGLIVVTKLGVKLVVMRVDFYCGLQLHWCLVCCFDGLCWLICCCVFGWFCLGLVICCVWCVELCWLVLGCLRRLLRVAYC